MALTILLIEDDARSIKLMQLILASAGYQTLVAEDGDEALSALQVGGFDLVVLDLMLPGVDGLEVLRQMRGDAQLSETPIIITSARAQPTTRQEATNLGADAYLTKPYRKDELLDTIASLMKSSV